MSLILQAFLEHERAIKRFLKRFRLRPQEIEDLSQETFLRAFAAEAVQDVREPRAFLFRIAKNLALNERAKHSNAMTDSMEDSADPSVLGSDGQVPIDEQVDARRRVRVLASAVASLPPQCARVFVLRNVHGYSRKEIAESLDISVSTVEKHVATGLLKCSEYLRKRGYEIEKMDGPDGDVASPKKAQRVVRERRSHFDNE